MSLILSYLSGIVAAFTPCVIVLMPILLYRFFHENEKQIVKFSIFTLSFVISYLIFGYFLSSLFTSSFQNGLRVGIGFLFVILGILALMNKLNPINFPLIKSNIGLGVIFSLIISFNPCTIPFLSVIISLNTNINIIINMFLFAIGIITPSIFFAFFSKKILDISRKSGKYMSLVDKFMNFILILSGIYLVFSIRTIDRYDILLISIFILFIFYILIRVFFIINTKKDLKNPGNILILISLILILFISYSHCSSNVGYDNSIINLINPANHQESNIYTCNGNIKNCEVCQRCIYLFSFSTILGFLGLWFIGKRKLK